MRLSLSILMSMILVSFSLIAQAGKQERLSFSYKDWELACDNTRTCRAAGYQADEEVPVSVLFTRLAGANQRVLGELMLGRDEAEGDDLLKKYPSGFNVTMHIDGHNFGEVAINKDSFGGNLSTKQVNGLLDALTHHTNIEWSIGKNSWFLSDAGASAVLLKMDEFQGRLGTKQAVIKKGTLGEDSVLPPLPMPVLEVPPIPKTTSNDKQLGKSKELLKSMLTAKGNDDCEWSGESDKHELDLLITRLTATKLLVSTMCWTAAYNQGFAYWVINDKPPYKPVLVTTSGNNYDKGAITSSMRGRGIGDCWSYETMTWEGKQFVQTDVSTSGMCKLITGGAWTLPTVVTKVQYRK